MMFLFFLHAQAIEQEESTITDSKNILKTHGFTDPKTGRSLRGCQDKIAQVDCDKYVEYGHCENLPDTSRENCASTCGLCGGGTELQFTCEKFRNYEYNREEEYNGSKKNFAATQANYKTKCSKTKDASSPGAGAVACRDSVNVTDCHNWDSKWTCDKLKQDNYCKPGRYQKTVHKCCPETCGVCNSATAKATTKTQSNTDSCFTEGAYSLNRGEKLDAKLCGTADECQQWCATYSRCKFFNFWGEALSDDNCVLLASENGTVRKRAGRSAFRGPKECPASSR